MPRGRPKSDKNPFDDLPEEFRDKARSLKREELQKEISKVACDQVELLKLKKEDQDLAECKERVKIANEPYALGSKQNHLKIRYMKQLLDDSGAQSTS